jgi:Beta-galactosidase
MKRKPFVILGSLFWTVVSCWGASAPATLTTAVRLHKGLPALYVNGKLTSSLFFHTTLYPEGGNSKDLPDFLNAGLKVAVVSLPYEGGEKSFYWTGPKKYEFDTLDAEIEGYVKQDPQILIMPKIDPVPGAWWCREFPNEISLQSDGSPTGSSKEQPCHFSFASKKYRSLARDALIALVAHLESKFGNNMLGYHLENGSSGEWFSWDAYGDGEQFGVEDYSAPAQAAFKEWLKQKYQGNPKNLQHAWGDATVTFESATIPSEKVRKHPSHGIVFDPAISRRVPDYFEFFNDTVTQVLLEQVHTIREVTHGRKIEGVFYGYLWSASPSLTMNHSGHLGFKKVLNSPDIDFIASPYTYDNRYVGGADTAQSLPATIALHHKLYLNEVDPWTHLAWGRSKEMDSERIPHNFAETKGILLRDYGYALTGGFGMWYMDIAAGLYHDPEITSLLSQVHDIDQKYLEADKRAATDVAVVLDEDSFNYFSDDEPFFMPLLVAQEKWELAFMGAPFDKILLSDFKNKSLPDYKCYIFVNTFRVTPEQRAAVHAKLQRNHATAVWVYAPGYIDNDLSVENMYSLTGIHLAKSDLPGELRVQSNAKDHPYTASLPTGLVYGTDVNVDKIRATFKGHVYLQDTLGRDLPGLKISPRFYGDDPQATVLGGLVGLDKPGLLVKEQGGWTSVYSSAPVLPAALLRNIARAAGCHIYDDANDVVYANKDFLAIYATSAGPRTVHLPRTSRVVDLLENKTLAEGASQFTVSMSANESRLFALE